MEVVSAQDTDPLVGCKLEYINPTNGQARCQRFHFCNSCPQAFHPVLIAPQRVWCSALLKGLARLSSSIRANNLNTPSSRRTHLSSRAGASNGRLSRIPSCSAPATRCFRRDLVCGDRKFVMVNFVMMWKLKARPYVLSCFWA